MLRDRIGHLRETAAWIAGRQRSDGCIPHWDDAAADPWDHVEAAMGLDVAGRHLEARRAYEWLARVQRADGAWAASYLDGRVVDGTLDANFTAYVAVGARHHYLHTEDSAWLESMWPAIERAVGFVLDLQLPDGSVAWARDPGGRPWPRALLTSSSCIHLSLRSAVDVARVLGLERPDWELAAVEVAAAVERGSSFQPKDRFAMDWYYPVLGGVLGDVAARTRLASRWDEFVVDGRGCRCVSDRLWVTSAETCELVMSLALAGFEDVAEEVFSWVQYLRDADGSYWTGATYPDDVIWPRERNTWSAGAVLLAADVLDPTSITRALFDLRDVGAEERVVDPL